MKALSIHQPFASLIAVEAKRFETRRWPAPKSIVGERVAFLSAKSTKELDLAKTGRFRECLAAAARERKLATGPDGELPLGYILCTARVVSCEVMGDGFEQRYDRDEIIFGHFTPTSYAWRLEDVVRCPDPIPYRGRQGVFDLDAVTSRRLMALATAVHRG